jgi:hypothetical protein
MKITEEELLALQSAGDLTEPIAARYRSCHARTKQSPELQSGASADGTVSDVSPERRRVAAVPPEPPAVNRLPDGQPVGSAPGIDFEIAFHRPLVDGIEAQPGV